MDTKPKALGPSRKGKGKEPEKSQAERFIETARQIGADESGADFESALRKIIPPKKGGNIEQES